MGGIAQDPVAVLGEIHTAEGSTQKERRAIGIEALVDDSKLFLDCSRRAVMDAMV